MSYTQVFAAAVAVAALIALAGSPAAQEGKEAKADTLQCQDAKHLQQASSKTFMQQMVKDREEALKPVQDTSKNPVIQKHLEMAKSVAASLK